MSIRNVKKIENPEKRFDMRRVFYTNLWKWHPEHGDYREWGYATRIPECLRWLTRLDTALLCQAYTSGINPIWYHDYPLAYPSIAKLISHKLIKLGTDCKHPKTGPSLVFCDYGVPMTFLAGMKSEILGCTHEGYEAVTRLMGEKKTGWYYGHLFDGAQLEFIRTFWRPDDVESTSFRRGY